MGPIVKESKYKADKMVTANVRCLSDTLNEVVEVKLLFPIFRDVVPVRCFCFRKSRGDHADAAWFLRMILMIKCRYIYSDDDCYLKQHYILLVVCDRS